MSLNHLSLLLSAISVLLGLTGIVLTILFAIFGVLAGLIRHDVNHREDMFQLRGFAARYLSHVVIAPHNAGRHLLLRQIQFAGIELRMQQQIRCESEDGIEVRLEA